MTHRTDDQIELLATRWLRDRGPDEAPEMLRLRLAEIAATRPRASRRPPLLLLAASLAAVISFSAAVVVGALLLNERSPKPSLPPAVPPAVSPAPSPTPPVSIAPSIDPTGDLPPIQFAGLLDADHGWVVGRDTFFATANAGATWISSPLPGPRVGRGVLGATFADPDVGWLATLDSTDPRSPVFDVWRTTDGGRTWTKAVLPEGANRSDTMGAADFSVVGTGHVLLWIEGGMPNGWTSDLYESTDAGATWSGPRTSSPGVSGLATFADGTHGVVAGGASGHDLIRTSDGGTTWESVRYPLPAGATRKLTTFPTPARFWDARHGAIAAIYSTPDLIPMLVILTTADAGATWTVAATRVDQGPVAFLDAEDWVEVTGASVGLSADGGTTWSTWAMPSLPGAISDLSMPDVRNGWAVVRDFGCHSGCEVSLVATTDGWHTAAALTPGAPGARPLASGTPEPTASTQAGLDVSALAFFDGRNGLVGGDAPTGGDSGANAAEGRIERTSDGGRTWDVTSYSGSPVLALAAADGLAWAATGCLDAPARRASSRARTAAGPGRPPHGIS